MGISIHIDDISKEQPEALWRTGAFLMDMAVEGGYVMDDKEHPVAHITAGVEAASAPVTPIFTVPANTEVIDVESGEITSAPDLTAVFGAGAHRPAIDLAVPVAVAAIESHPAPAPVPPSPTAELDARGFPWDARIHGRTKAKIGDGTWRYRRGSTDEEIVQIEAELRQTMGAPVAAQVTPPPPAPAAPAPAAPAPAVPAPAVPAPAVPAVPAVPAAPAPAAPGTEDFGAFMQFVISNVAAGKVTQPQVIEIVQEFGLPHVGAVFQRQDLIPQIRAKIEALIA